MAAVAELARLLRAGETAAVAGGARDRRGAGRRGEDGRARRRGAAPGRGLARVAEAARRYLLAPMPVAIPEMSALARDLDPPLGLARAIDETFDAAGEIRNTASPELERLRAERQGLQDRARIAIEELMRVDEYASVMQDQFFTDPRRALRAAAEGEREVAGARHRSRHVADRRDGVRRADGAGRGQQPAQGHRAGHPARVAADPRTVDGRRRGGRGTAAAAAATLAAIDARAAAARLAVAYGGNPVEIVEAPIVDLRVARHPLLALAHPAADVVANDVVLGGGQPPILIVSGPNAGGKTVLMKTVGLAALMARAGLLVAADAPEPGWVLHECAPTSATGSR